MSYNKLMAKTTSLQILQQNPNTEFRARFPKHFVTRVIYYKWDPKTKHVDDRAENSTCWTSLSVRDFTKIIQPGIVSLTKV
jgi:hypothetical protein